MQAQTNEPQLLSVSELIKRLSHALESEFPHVQFSGEIGEMARPASGHLYLTIKDENSQIRAVMWQGLTRGLGFVPKEGDKVNCVGKPNVFGSRGQLQIILSRMVPAGEGELRKKFLELKAKLEKEGYFAESRKRPLPYLPRAVGVVTSAGGAVIHDIEVKIRERFPQMPVFLVDVRVQGAGAAKEIAAGVKLLDESGLVDVIIVARGGGSLEDLWAFNEVEVVKAIFASKTIVVSGVGHEVDVTLSDLVADVRAPTPTAAAEMVVPRREELLQAIAGLEGALFDLDRWFFPLVQKLDDNVLRLGRAVGSYMAAARLRLDSSEAHVRSLKPQRIVEMFRGRVELLRERLYGRGMRGVNQARSTVDAGGQQLRKVIEAQLFRAQSKLSSVAGKLDALSPMKVLERGYSIVEIGGRIIRDSSEVNINDTVEVTLARGGLEATVSAKK